MSTQILTAREVIEATFETTRMREGYNQDQVDDFLDLICETLKVYEKGGAPAVSGREPAADSVLEAQARELEQHRQALATFETELRAAERSLTDREAALGESAERLALDQDALQEAQANAMPNHDGDGDSNRTEPHADRDGTGSDHDALGTEHGALRAEHQALRVERDEFEAHVKDLKLGMEALNAQRVILEEAVEQLTKDQTDLRTEQDALTDERTRVEELQETQRLELSKLKAARASSTSGTNGSGPSRRDAGLRLDRRPSVLDRPSWMEPVDLPPVPITVEEALKTLADAGYLVTLSRSESTTN